MLQKIARTLRITGYSLLGAAFTTAVGPWAYETVHNERQQGRIEESIEKITQEKFFICDPAAAGHLQNDRAAQLVSVMTAAANGLQPSWSEPVALYKNGLLRLSNNMSGVVKLTQKLTGRTLPAEYTKGDYQSPLDNGRQNLEDLANLGVGVCFDKSLTAQGLGSAYVRGEGMIVLNPVLQREALAVHIQRHLARQDQELVKPYDRLVTSGQEQRSPFSERAAQLHAFVDLLDGPALALALEEDANVADFKELAVEKYTPPLLQQPAAPAPQKK